MNLIMLAGQHELGVVIKNSVIIYIITFQVVWWWWQEAVAIEV